MNDLLDTTFAVTIVLLAIIFVIGALENGFTVIFGWIN